MSIITDVLKSIWNALPGRGAQQMPSLGSVVKVTAVSFLLLSPAAGAPTKFPSLDSMIGAGGTSPLHNVTYPSRGGNNRRNRKSKSGRDLTVRTTP